MIAREQKRRISRSQALNLAAIALQIASVARLTVYLPEVIRPCFLILALIVIPGVMSARLLYRQTEIQFWQVIGLGIGLGLAEAFVWGRLFIAAGIATYYLGYVLIITSLIKNVWLWRHGSRWAAAQKENWRLVIVPVILLAAISLTLVQVNLAYPSNPVNTVRINDKWSYLTIIQQFLVSPGNLNLRPDTIILGSNMRLSWNSWLYVTAAISHFSGIEPVPFIFQYFRPALLLVTFLTLVLLGYELFQKTSVALNGAALQLFLINALNISGLWLWMRLEEDKFFAFATLVPLAWVFLLRAAKYRHWPDVIGLTGISLSLALLHPLGVPGLLLTGAPLVVVEWWLNHNAGFSFKWLVILLVCMGIFMGITFSDRLLVEATPYVQNYVDVNGSLPVYTLDTVPNLLPIQARFILLALIPLGFFALKDQVARFLFLSTAACAAVLCIPIVTIIVSEVSTAAGINRYQWLIPYGFIFMWLILKIAERWPARFLHPSIQTAALCIVFIVISGWDQWTTQAKPWLFWQETPDPSLTLSDSLWQGFQNTAPLVAGKRAITPVEYGLVAPTLWPGADLLLFNSPIHAPINWPKIDALYHVQDIATAWTLIDDIQPKALYVPHSTALYNVLAQNPADLSTLYSNDEATLFAPEGMKPLRKGDVMAFNANQYTLTPSNCAHLQWNTAEASDVRLDGQPVDTSGEKEVCPVRNTVFHLQSTRQDGSSASRILHIFVSPDYDYMASFSADHTVVQAGSCVILHWHVEGIDSVYYQDKPTVGEGSSSECPLSNTLYSLRVKLRNQETIVRNITIYVRDENR